MATPPDATIPLKAERVGNMWTVSAVLPDGMPPVVMGSGPSSTGIMIPVTLFEQLVEQEWVI